MSARWLLELLVLSVPLAACRLASPVLSPTEVFERVAASSVIVRTRAGTTASGTVIHSEPGRAIVLTARHVVDGAVAKGTSISIATTDGTGAAHEMPARVAAVDPDHDLALLEVATTLDIPALPIAEEEPRLYEDLFVVASPMGLEGIAAPAVLSAKEPRGATVWAITSFIFFGSSGGTVANGRAELVAVPVVIPTFKSWIITQLAFCVPLHAIHDFLATAVERSFAGAVRSP